MITTPRMLLTPAAVHILLVLAESDAHGYAIREAVAARTEGALQLGPGTLYEAIHRLEVDGWIREVHTAPDARRRTYRITLRGRRVLVAELRRLEALVRSARAAGVLEEPA